MLVALNDDLLEQFGTSMDAFRALREKDGWKVAPQEALADARGGF
jgi:hypothetical protein